MRNLGPSCKQDLNSVGIKTANDVKRLGTEETFVRMILGRVQQGRGATSCNATYLYFRHPRSDLRRRLAGLARGNERTLQGICPGTASVRPVFRLARDAAFLVGAAIGPTGNSTEFVAVVQSG